MNQTSSLWERLRESNLFWISILIILTFGMYNNCLDNKYSLYDDNTLIVDNFSFLKKKQNISKAFKQEVFQIPGIINTHKEYYRPLLTVSYIIDAQFAKTDSNGFPLAKTFFLSNIIWHLMNVLLVYFWLIHLTGSKLKSGIFSLLFALHPLHCMAVGWIPGRNDIVLASFFLILLHGLSFILRKISRVIYSFL